jgi:hypothetical protein
MDFAGAVVRAGHGLACSIKAAQAEEHFKSILTFLLLFVSSQYNAHNASSKRKILSCFLRDKKLRKLK